jgi:hypothetical protein
MGVSITRIVKFIRKGKGVIVAQSQNVYNYTYKEWTQFYGLSGRSVNWDGIINVSDFSVGDTMVIKGTVSDKQRITISLYAKVTAIDTNRAIITAQSLYYIASGENGKDGNDGVDAITIDISPENILHKKATTKSNYKVNIKVYRGDTALSYGDDGFSCSGLATMVSGFSYKGSLSGNVYTYDISIEANKAPNTSIRVTIKVGNKIFPRNIKINTVADGQPGAKGDRGPVLRPQAWNDCAVGYVFQSGASGEEYKDVVLYGGNYYSCIKSHTKTASNNPGSATDTNSGLWELAYNFEMVATKILLAQYALVKNLGVEAIEMKDANGKIVFQAINGKVTCNSGTFNNIKVTGDSEFSGTMKAVSGSFKSLNCVNNKGEVVGNITFGSDGRMWFDGDMYSQGYRSDKKRSNRFYTSDVFCRGMFGHFGKTMAVVKGTYMYVYSKGADQSGVYVSLKTGKTSNNKTFYYIPLYSPSNTDDLSGMPIDVVVFNTTSDYYYAFSSMGNGKEWRVINGNDRQTVHFCDIGGWHELVGGASVNCVYVNPEWLNPVPNKNDIARGVFWTGEKDLNW